MGIPETRDIKPETLQKYERVKKLVADHGGKGYLMFCKRVGISYAYFQKLRAREENQKVSA